MSRLAAFAAQLFHTTGSRDLVIGCFLTNRNRPEVQDMIGFFVNHLAVRLDLDGDPTFLELLARVRKVTLEATAHSDLPFDELRAELRQQGIRLPESQFLFAVTYGETSTVLGDIRARRMERKRGSMPWGLQLSVNNSGDQSGGMMRFDSNLYDPTGVAQMLSGFTGVLAKVAENPEVRLSQLHLPAATPSLWRRLFGTFPRGS